jgi:hypothetical protein
MAFLPAKRAYCMGCYGHTGIEERRHDIQMCRLGGETESGVKRLGRESPAGEGLPDFRQVTITTRNMKCVDISCICAVGWHSINKSPRGLITISKLSSPGFRGDEGPLESSPILLALTLKALQCCFRGKRAFWGSTTFYIWLKYG